MKLTMMVLAILIYMGMMLYIGVRCSKQNKSSNDFYLGGRKLGPFVTAMSAEASDMSGWLLMGFPGSILAFGMGKVWIGIGLALGTALNWILVAQRLRRFSQAATARR